MKISQDDNSPQNAIATRQFTSGSLTLAPGETKQLPLGSYGETEPAAEFKITSSPNIDDQLGSSLEKMQIPGGVKYILFYHLHNYSSEKCEVTVKKVSGRDGVKK